MGLKKILDFQVGARLSVCLISATLPRNIAPPKVGPGADQRSSIAKNGLASVDLTYKVTNQTAFRIGKKKASFGDLKAGESVGVT
jgi:hypothetical protein